MYSIIVQLRDFSSYQIKYFLIGFETKVISITKLKDSK